MTRRAFRFLSALATMVAVAACLPGVLGAAPDEQKPATELKVFAQQLTPLGGPQVKGRRPIASKGPLPTAVIRSAEELVAVTGPKDKAKDAAAQKEAATSFAKALGVAKIDWGTQMVVIIDEQEAINRSVSVGPFKVQGKKVRVTYNINTRQGGAAMRGRCRAVLLVERWAGDVEFTRTYSKSGNPLAP